MFCSGMSVEKEMVSFGTNCKCAEVLLMGCCLSLTRHTNTDLAVWLVIGESERMLTGRLSVGNELNAP